MSREVEFNRWAMEVNEPDVYDDEVFAPALSRITGVAVEKLIRCKQGEDPEVVYTAEDRVALARFARWAAQSRYVKSVFREVAEQQREARAVFDGVME